MDLASCSAIRKKKTTTEQHVRERKSNATKQFAYNKLKTERHQSVKSKPLRPPQPKVSNEKEGMLIDLSPNENPLNSNGQVAMSQTPTNMSLLDAPIDVPTENSGFDLADVRTESRLEPPPYQYPPTYMNTLGLGQPDNNVNKSFSTYHQSHHSDPFDTSYVSDDPNLTANSNTSLNAVYNNIQTTNAYRYGSNIEKNVQISQRNAGDGKHNNSNGAIAKQKPLTSELDTLVMNTMASLGPRNSVKNLSFSGTDSKYSNNLQWNSSMQNADIDSSNSESLSDSLRVNLSALSLDDSVNNSAATPKKLDKSLYSDLEKEIYKSESTSSSVNVNTSQNYDRISLSKENSVSAIPSEIYERRSEAAMSSAFSLNKVQNSTTKPVKQTNTLTKSTNQEIAQVHRNPYEIPINFTQNPISSTKNYSSSVHPYAKQNNTEMTASNSTVPDTNTVINQIWFEQTAKDMNVHSPRKSFYSNVTQPQIGTEKNHNFVAISNRPTSMIQNDTKPLNTNIYSSVAGDFYSSVAGDFYDTVPSNNSASALYVSMPRNNTNSIYGNESQTVPVIYDEVTNEDLLRPHRPAPLAPPPLSSQQIQRRMEKERQNQLQQQQIYGNLAAGTANGLIESQKVLQLMQEVGDDATHIEATQALQAVGWDHSLAVRHFKIERLLR